jgi:ABC-type multidrug transport system permease subunit
MPLSFVSSAFVPTASMPAWLRVFADHQPVTVLVNAVRYVSGGDLGVVDLPQPGFVYVNLGLLWCVAIMIVTVPACIALVRRR